jgi:4,5-DOPA dioxygenase extradiol
MRIPAVYAAQGSPRLLLHPAWPDRLHTWARQLPQPHALLIVSAHWEAAPLTVGSLADPVPLYYDYYGFPEPFYRLSWPAPPARDLAVRIAQLTGSTQSLAHEPARGLDHGAFIPLMLMWPEHDIPVVQLSMPSLDPHALLALGRQLAPLRDEGVLIFGTGLMTHASNGDVADGAAAEPFLAFDRWVADCLERRRFDELAAYRNTAPHVRTVLPSHEHFAPLFVALGAAIDDLEGLTFPTTGFWRGNSMRSVQFN